MSIRNFNLERFNFRILLYFNLYVGADPQVDVGPVISPQAKQRILKLIQSGIDEGASLLLDGRKIVVPGYEKGNFIGPTILTDVKVRRHILYLELSILFNLIFYLYCICLFIKF